MSEMHFKQPGFTNSACGLFTKNKEWVQRFKETEDSRYTYQNNKVCFQFDMAYGILKTYQELFLIKYYMRNHYYIMW